MKRASNSPTNEWAKARALALRVSENFAYREWTERVIIVMVTEKRREKEKEEERRREEKKRVVQRERHMLFPITVCDLCGEVAYVCLRSDSIMEGHMHEHGLLYTRGVVWCGDTVRERARLVSSRGQSDVVLIVVSCDHESGSCMCLRLCFFKIYIRRCLLSCLLFIFYVYMVFRWSGLFPTHD